MPAVSGQAEHVLGSQASPRQPGDHLRMPEGGIHGAGELLEQHHRLPRGRSGGHDGAARDVDDGGAEAGLAEQMHEGAARRGIALRPGEHVGLRRLDQLDERVPRPLVRLARRAQDLGDAQHFRGGQPVEGMGERRRGREHEGGQRGCETGCGHGRPPIESSSCDCRPILTIRHVRTALLVDRAAARARTTRPDLGRIMGGYANVGARPPGRRRAARGGPCPFQEAFRSSSKPAGDANTEPSIARGAAPDWRRLLHPNSPRGVVAAAGLPLGVADAGAQGERPHPRNCAGPRSVRFMLYLPRPAGLSAPK